MKKTVVIGLGFMGVVHAKNILADNELELCAIVDNRGDVFRGIENTGNAGRLDLPVERIKKTPVYKTLEECCREASPDAAVICVPLFLHYEMTRKALGLGLDVLLEKPFCPEPGQCRKLIDLAGGRKQILMVAHCIRFAPEWEFIAECIKDKRYGKLKLLSTIRTTGEPSWGIWQDKKIKKTCGGALMDLLIHDIDFASYCLGKPETVNSKLNVDEYWELELEYKSNPAKISIKGGFLHRNSPFTSECIATFEFASIRFNSLQPGIINIGSDAGLGRVKVNGDMYARELEYFAKCIEKRNQPEKCFPEDSLAAIEICRTIQKDNDGAV